MYDVNVAHNAVVNTNINADINTKHWYVKILIRNTDAKFNTVHWCKILTQSPTQNLIYKTNAHDQCMKLIHESNVNSNVEPNVYD